MHLHNNLQVFFGQCLHRKSAEFFHKKSYVEVKNKNFHLCKKEFFFTMKHYFKIMANLYKTSLHQTQAGTVPSLAQKATWITFNFSSDGFSYKNREVKVTSTVRINREGHLRAWQQFKVSSALIGTERGSQQQHHSENSTTFPSRELRFL